MVRHLTHLTHRLSLLFLFILLAGQQLTAQRLDAGAAFSGQFSLNPYFEYYPARLPLSLVAGVKYFTAYSSLGPDVKLRFFIDNRQRFSVCVNTGLLLKIKPEEYEQFTDTYFSAGLGFGDRLGRHMSFSAGISLLLFPDYVNDGNDNMVRQNALAPEVNVSLAYVLFDRRNNYRH